MGEADLTLRETRRVLSVVRLDRRLPDRLGVKRLEVAIDNQGLANTRDLAVDRREIHRAARLEAPNQASALGSGVRGNGTIHGDLGGREGGVCRRCGRRSAARAEQQRA